MAIQTTANSTHKRLDEELPEPLVEKVDTKSPVESEEESSDDEAPEEEGFNSAKQQAAEKEKDIAKSVDAQNAKVKAQRRSRNQVLAEQKKNKKPKHEDTSEEEDDEDDEEEVDELLPAEVLDKFDGIKKQSLDDEGISVPEKSSRDIALEALEKQKKRKMEFNKGPVTVKVLRTENKRAGRIRSRAVMPPAATGSTQTKLKDEWLNRGTVDRRAKVTQTVRRV